MKTIFCDIDGTILKHYGSMYDNIIQKPEVLSNVIKKFNEWDKLCYKIILTTGRRESLRELTEKQLLDLGIAYDELIMGLPNGDRIVINDRKKDSDKNTAFAINLNRNEGFDNIFI